MSFRQIVLSALIVGIVSGIVYGMFQQLQINPIIYAAETYEVESVSGSASEGTGDSHSHNHEHWSPEDGLERMASTLGSNVLIAIGFALVMISAMSLHNALSGRPPVTWKSGIFWGLGMMASMFVAPALLGVHPEIPGTVADPLAHRQLWWITTALCTAAGLLVLYYAPRFMKLAGLVLLVIPHLFGAPVPDTLSFANTEPEAVHALTELSSQFVMMTTIGMVVFCVLIGALCGSASKWMHKNP